MITYNTQQTNERTERIDQKTPHFNEITQKKIFKIYLFSNDNLWLSHRNDNDAQVEGRGLGGRSHNTMNR